jgi:hypothetical protein
MRHVIIMPLPRGSLGLVSSSPEPLFDHLADRETPGYVRAERLLVNLILVDLRLSAHQGGEFVHGHTLLPCVGVTGGEEGQYRGRATCTGSEGLRGRRPATTVRVSGLAGRVRGWRMRWCGRLLTSFNPWRA